MQNEPNFSKSQMFITLTVIMNCNEKCKLDTWSKRTQSNPIYGEPVEPTKPILPATPFGGLVPSDLSAEASAKAEVEGSIKT
jgi:hypothetical protein